MEVETNGFSDIFPEHIPIGKVERVEDSADGLSYSLAVKLYTDFSFTNYPSEPIRLWISPDDHRRLLDTPLDADRSLLNIKVHSVSIFQPESRTWCRYSPAHPHGSGHLFAVGALTAILFLVLVIKKVFYP